MVYQLTTCLCLDNILLRFPVQLLHYIYSGLLRTGLENSGESGLLFGNKLGNSDLLIYIPMPVNLIIAIVAGLLLGGAWTLYFPFNKRLQFGLFDGLVFIAALVIAFVVAVVITWVWKLRIAGQI